MSRSESVVVTALCMVYDNDKILLQDRIESYYPLRHVKDKA